MSRGRIEKWLTIVCIGVLAAAPGWGQEYRATILGVVSDSSGSTVPGAKVMAINMDTEVRTSTEANGEGNYVIPYLNPGKYRLRVEHPGFKSFERSPIELRINDRVNLDVRLEVGQVSDNIVVTAEVPLLEQATGDRGQVIDNAQVSSLPLNGGNPYELMNMAAGAVYTGSLTYTRPFNEGSAYSINGGRQRYNEFQIDGISSNAANNGEGFIMGYVPPREATQEFKVQTSTYDAQYGRTGGGVINLSVKSGNNQFHATAYEGLRRTPFEANQYVNNANGAARAEHTLDQYGWLFSGPVTLPRLYRGKDRTFFMFAMERYREGQPQAALGYVPTAEQKTGDFSRTLTREGSVYTAYDPLTVYDNPRYDPTKAVTLTNLRSLRLPFAGNLVPKDRMNAVALNVLKDIPLPNRPGDAVTGVNNWVGADVSEKNSFQNLLARVDHSFSGSVRMYGRWNHAMRKVFKDYWGWNTLATSAVRTARGSDGAVFDVAATVSPSTILNARIGFNRYQDLVDAIATPQIYQQLGFPPALAGQLQVQDRYPVMTFTDYLQVGYSPGTDLHYDGYTAQASIMRQIGSHTLKFGGEFRLMHLALTPRSNGAGTYAFTRSWTSLSPDTTDPNSGNAIASLLLGTMGSATAAINAQPYYSEIYPVAYLQHDWRVNARLTLNMGFRWDYESPAVERFNRQNRGFDFQAKSPVQAPGLDLRGGLLFAGSNGLPRGAFDADYLHPQPRFGLAYKVLRSKPLVFRGGFGRSFLPTNDNGGSTGFSQTTSAVVTTPGGALPFQLLNDPFPNGLRQPPGASLGLAAQLGDAITFSSTDRAVPHVWQYSAGFQYEFAPGMLADIAYAGSQTSRLGVSRDLNFLTPDQLALGTVALNGTSPNPFYGVLGAETSRGRQSTIALRTLLLPYPHYTSVTMTKQSIGSSWYHSLQLRLQKRFKYGITYLATYTAAKNLEAVARLNNSDQQLAHDLVSYDVSQRLTMSGTVEFPFGRRKKWLNTGIVSRVVSGWQLSWTGVVQTGSPISYPDYYLYGNPKLESGQTLGRWFDTSKDIWVQRPPDTLRTTPLHSPNIRRHSAPQFSSTLTRRFRIRERHNFQVRGSAFNLTNTPIFGFPNTTPTSPLFGVVSEKQINLPRSIEMGFRYSF